MSTSTYMTGVGSLAGGFEFSGMFPITVPIRPPGDGIVEAYAFGCE